MVCKENTDFSDYLTHASFWTPDCINASDWIEHGPFAFWLMQVCQPKTLVELGTHTGYSYLAFCQAVKRLGMYTRCHAIDTWNGDEHTGFYSDAVFKQLSDYHNQHYSGFSQLVRSTFDDALKYFGDGSIDLLHFDGRHYYNDVKHDFESWRPKLSDRAVVIFHDINVRTNDFGVFKFWGELCQKYPHFEFMHGWGLGVMAVGDHIPESLRTLFAAPAEDIVRIREAYSRLGSAVLDRLVLSQQTATIQSLEKELSASTSAVQELNMLLARLDYLERENEHYKQYAKELNQVLKEVTDSRFWKLGTPVRKVLAKIF